MSVFSGQTITHGSSVGSFVASSVQPVTPADCSQIEYTPTLLLPLSLPASFLAESDYSSSCQWGFNTYFEEMLEPNEEGTDFVVVNHFYTRAEVASWVVECFFPTRLPGPVALVDCVGVIHGWLSALALVDRELALCGGDLLVALVNHRLVSQQWGVNSPFKQ